MNSSVGRKVVALTGISLAVLLTACKDKRVSQVNSGITRDSLLTVIGKGAPGMDSLPNVYRFERYLIGGKTYEIFYFSGTGEHLNAAAKDTVAWKDLTPIAIVDRVVVGKEWPFVDSLFKAHNIPAHKHEK